MKKEFEFHFLGVLRLETDTFVFPKQEAFTGRSDDILVNGNLQFADSYNGTCTF